MPSGTTCQELRFLVFENRRQAAPAAACACFSASKSAFSGTKLLTPAKASQKPKNLRLVKILPATPPPNIVHYKVYCIQNTAIVNMPIPVDILKRSTPAHDGRGLIILSIAFAHKRIAGVLIFNVSQKLGAFKTQYFFGFF